MAEYEVKLQDDFSGPAQGVAAAAKAIGSQTKAASAAMRKFAHDMTAMGRAAAQANSVQKRFPPMLRDTAGRFLQVKTSFEKARGKLDDWRTSVAFASKGTKELNNNLVKLKGTTRGATLQGFLEGIGHRGVALIERGAQAVLGLGQRGAQAAFELAFFGDASRKALGRLLKDAGAGEAAFDDMVATAKKLGLPIQETVASFQQLIMRGFTKEAAKDFVLMGADLQAVGASAQDVQIVMRNMGKILSQGKVQGDEIQSLAEAGVSTSRVYDILGKKLGKTRDKIISMQSEGKLLAKDVLPAIQQAVMETVGETRLGEAAEEFAKGMGGMKGRVLAAVEGIGLAVGDAMAPGMSEGLDKLFGIIQQIAASPAMASLGETLGGMMSGLADALPGIMQAFSDAGPGFATLWQGLVPILSGLGDLLMGTLLPMLSNFAAGIGTLLIALNDLGVISAVIGLLKIFGGVLNTIFGICLIVGEAFAALAATIGVFLAPLLNLIPMAGQALTELGNTISEWAGSIGATLTAVGVAMAEGIASGIRSAASAVVSALGGVVDAAIASVVSKLDIGSPSKVFEEFGMQTSMGFALGVEGSSGEALGAMTGLVAPPPTAGEVGGGMGGGIGSVQISIDTAGAMAAAQSSKDPPAFSAAVMNMIRNQLADELELVMHEMA